MPLAKDLLHPSRAKEQNTHKLKKIVQSPNSFFMDVKCPICYNISTLFSHATTKVKCQKCHVLLSSPKGGKAQLREGCSFRRKNP